MQSIETEPLQIKHRSFDPWALSLGIELKHVGYTWRPYHDRPPDHRKDYDRLRENMRNRIWTGLPPLINPLICFRGAVLIGMRRCEIARELEVSNVPIIDILTDISEDKTPDRVLALRDKYVAAPY